MIQTLLQWLRRHRVHVYRNSLPKGANLIADLKRYGLDNGIRSLIDVGANVGDFSSEFLQEFPQLQQVIAIEPEPQNFEKLTRNLANPKVQCLQCAIGEQAGTGSLHLSALGTMHSLSTTSSGQDSLEVAIHPLSYAVSHLSENSRVFLKTDTEGYDAAVLSGGREFLESGCCSMVLCEVAFHQGQYLSQFQKIWGLLEGMGFDLFGFYDQSEYRPWHGLDHCNALFIHAKAAAAYLPESASHPWEANLLKLHI